MSIYQSTSLIPEEVVPLLIEQALFHGDFQKFTGLERPWDVDMNVLTQLRKKLMTVERRLRSRHPKEPITCVTPGSMMVWLRKITLDRLLEDIYESINRLRIHGPLPLWRMTTSELLDAHIVNMKRLILAASHDLVLLELLRDSFGDYAGVVGREFKKCEHLIRRLLDGIEDQENFHGKAVSQNLQLYERLTITYLMMERGELTPAIAGYSMADLKRVEAILDNRCKRELPAYRQQIGAMLTHMKDALREGESVQLLRVSHWMKAFAAASSIPDNFFGHAMISQLEKEGYALALHAREEEMGPSETGQSALKAAEDAASLTLQPVSASSKEPLPKLQLKSKQFSEAKQKFQQRMIYSPPER